MPVEYDPFDIAEHLDSEEMIAGYLSAAAEDEDPNVLLAALAHAVKARGMMQVAKDAGLSRESLYKALKPGAHPRFETVRAVLRALGVKLAMSVEPLAPSSKDDLPSIVGGRKVVLGKGKVVKAMTSPEVSEKIAKRSYRSSGVVRAEPDLVEPEKTRGRGHSEKAAETAGKVEPGTQAPPKKGRASGGAAHRS